MLRVDDAEGRYEPVIRTPQLIGRHKLALR